jgi:hypothetical protein
VQSSEGDDMSLGEVQEIVAVHMDEIARLFKPGVKIAVLVRTPGFPDRDFMMTDDATSELIAMVERRAKAEIQRRREAGESPS